MRWSNRDSSAASILPKDVSGKAGQRSCLWFEEETQPCRPLGFTLSPQGPGGFCWAGAQAPYAGDQVLVPPGPLRILLSDPSVLSRTWQHCQAWLQNLRIIRIKISSRCLISGHCLGWAKGHFLPCPVPVLLPTQCQLPPMPILCITKEALPLWKVRSVSQILK